MARWETVNSGVRLHVESCLQPPLLTLNLHVYFFSFYYVPPEHGSPAAGLDCVRSIQWIYV